MIRQTFAASPAGPAEYDIHDPRTWPDVTLESQRVAVWQYHRECLRRYPLAASYWADRAVRLEAETARRFNAVAVCQEAA